MFDLSEALSIPVVRDKLGKGMALHQLDELMQFYERAKSDQYVLKTYGGMMQDLEFLTSVGATKPPVVPRDSLISISYHWIAIKGYYTVNPYWLQEEGIQQRVIVNTPSLYVPVISLHHEAWRVFCDMWQHSHVNSQTRMWYYLYLLIVLRNVGMTYEDYVMSHFVDHTVRNTDYQYVAEYVQEHLSDVLVSDRYHVIEKLLAGKYCMPCGQWIRADESYHNIVVPTWTLTSRGTEDLTGNRINQWDFFLSSS